MRSIRFTGIGLLLAMTGCGFHPVYAPGTAGLPSAAAAELAAVEVALIPDRNGQILRQDVQARLERFGLSAAKRYKLTVSFALTEDAEGIQPDTSATYTRVQARANWWLYQMDPKSTQVTTGVARATDGFNVIDEQPFAFDLENESVVKKLAERLADDIALQLGIYFQRQANGPA